MFKTADTVTVSFYRDKGNCPATKKTALLFVGAAFPWGQAESGGLRPHRPVMKPKPCLARIGRAARPAWKPFSSGPALDEFRELPLERRRGGVPDPAGPPVLRLRGFHCPGFHGLPLNGKGRVEFVGLREALAVV